MYKPLGLDPCRNCGGEGALTHDTLKTGEYEYYVICNRCGARSQGERVCPQQDVELAKKLHEEAMEAAVKNWNQEQEMGRIAPVTAGKKQESELVTIYLTRGQCASLAQLIEGVLLEQICSDPHLDNLKYVAGIAKAWGVFKRKGKDV